MASSLLSDEQVFGAGPPAGGQPGLMSDAQVFGEVELDRGATGAGFIDRALASFKSGPEGAAAYYKTVHGPENVRVQGGEVLFRPSPTAPWRPADSSRLELADMADLVGDLPEIIGGVGGAALGATGGSIVPGAGTVAGGVVGAAGGSAAGNVVRQSIGAFVPGEENRTLGSRALETGASAALGGVSQGAASALSGPVTRLVASGQLPKALSAWLTRTAERGAAPGALKEAADVEARIPGLALTTGQRTGSQAVLRAEQASEMGALASQYGRETAEQNTAAVMGSLDNVVNRMAGGVQVDTQQLGHTLKSVRDDWADDVFSHRASQAAKDFAQVDAVVGHTPIVDPSRMRQILSSKLATNVDDHGRVIHEGLQKDLEYWLARSNKMMSASDTQKYLHLFGKAGYGKGAKVFDSLHIGEATQLQRQLHGALLDDLADTAAQTGQGTAAKTLSDALLKARENYKLASGNIEKLEKSALQRVVGNMDEGNLYKVGERFLGLKSKTDQDRIIRGVRAIDPSQTDVLARGVLENAIERSMVVPAGSATGERVFSPTRFFKSLPDKEIRDLLFDPQASKQIDAIMTAMRRLNLKGFKGESPTAEKLINYGQLSAGVGTLLNPLSGAAGLMAVIGRRQVAKHLITREGRDALQLVLKPQGKTTPPRVKQALFYLLGENAGGQ